MKKLLIPFALVLALAATLSNAGSDKASAASSTAGKVKSELTRIAKELNLTPDQVAQLKPILTEQMGQIKELQGSGLSKTEKAAKFNDIRQSASAEIKKILTPEQLAKWDAEVANAKKFLGAKIPK